MKMLFGKIRKKKLKLNFSKEFSFQIENEKIKKHDQM